MQTKVKNKNRLLSLVYEGRAWLSKRNIKSAHHEIMDILCSAVNKKPIDIYTQDIEISRSQIKNFSFMMRQLALNTPIQYIIKNVNFMGLGLLVEEGVFIPRPETEILVEALVNLIKQRPVLSHNPLDICEIGTGSANIAISLTKLVDNCKILATDISKKALEIARRNIEAHGVGERLKIIHSDMFEGIGHKKFDIIVSNPPYIPSSQINDLPAEVRMEPRQALDGGDTGLDFYRKIIPRSENYLKGGGFLAFEIGDGQSGDVEGILNKNNFKNITVIKDLNGINRIIIAQWTS